MALAQVLQLHVHPSDMASAILYADLDEDMWKVLATDIDISRNWNKYTQYFILILGFEQSILHIYEYIWRFYRYQIVAWNLELL